MGTLTILIIMGKDDSSWVPNGHFYSPIVGKETIDGADFNEIKTLQPGRILGIELHEVRQLKIVDQLRNLRLFLDFPEMAAPGHLYNYENPFFSYGDAGALVSIITLKRPKQIIEVGSGFSTALMIELREKLDWSYEIICIEPYPDVLNSLVGTRKVDSFRILATKIQDVDVSIFRELTEGDILFIDSTHVSKFQSDVNFIFQEVLPSLNKGVIVHFHDIFWPFEYPEAWLREGRSWNEAYLLRTFLQYNSKFEIFFWPHMLFSLNNNVFKNSLPFFERNSGASIYLLTK